MHDADSTGLRTAAPVRAIPAPRASARTEAWAAPGTGQRLGAFRKCLRTLSLDELPQQWNVLREDMSLVGPRPERRYLVEEFSRQDPHYGARHRVPAGRTGWAQASGLRGDTDISERARNDNAYIANWSLWNGTKIMLSPVARFTARASL